MGLQPGGRHAQGTGQVIRRWLARLVPSEDPIDALIAEKGVTRYRPGMETPDWRILRMWGRRNFARILDAERRGLKAVK